MKKIYAIVDKNNREIVYGTSCNMAGREHLHESYLAVFEEKKMALLAKKNHSNFYKNCVIKEIATKEV